MPPPPPPPRRNDSKAASAASKEENIYIPSFISKRPFYAGEEGEGQTDYLEHQRLQKTKDDQSKWYDRGKKLGPAATKYRKGACENCGAMTHKTKECLSRPRAKGARWTGKDIQADEVVQDVQLGWDAKRDRWNGYDPKEYRGVVERYNQMEELRSKLSGSKDGGKVDGEDDNDDAGEKYAEESDMGRHQSTATRQLRIREDTAKYLLNLDLESAKYDPKTRTMVDAGATADKAAQLFAEEGFLRASGDAAEFEKAQKYAWEKQEKMGDTSQHLQANPTAGEFFRKKEKEEAEKQRAAQLKALEEKYGVSQHTMPETLKDFLVTESETFNEYDEAGLIKGAPRAAAKSKYAEDVYINNHTSVWGSWWSSFKWGYACCHSFIKNSYCTGEEGKRAWEEAERQRTGVGLEKSPDQEEEADGTTVEESEPRKPVAKKRTAGEMMDGVTEAELEEYRRKRAAADDPMARFLGKDELVR
ncbi:hypothetical protein DL764_002704 [Monosporascus ibericus]|uniref:Pre-mRNA-splicing factor SLU7 n=1 Tax=Monosporascus ibericus TaxID=155417 RepID=A0A4Q4TMT8_9PEZI|nr:hypothetical protein DL764_002704 [Monosporascus ibericus]